MSYVDRYVSGEDVWLELVALKDAVRQESLRSEVIAISRIVATTMLANIEEMVTRLRHIGYRFESEPFTKAALDCGQVLDEVENLIGHPPLFLRVWYEVIGSVDFNDFHPEWKVMYTDPFMVGPACLDYIRSEYEQWREEARDDAVDDFRFDVAPDYYHKADVSGGSPYSFAVPNESLDGILLEEPNRVMFYGYLQLGLKWGGFPGITRQPDGIPKAHLEILQQPLARI